MPNPFDLYEVHPDGSVSVAGRSLRDRVRELDEKREEARWEVYRARMALQAAAYALDLVGNPEHAARLRAVDRLVRDLEGTE